MKNFTQKLCFIATLFLSLNAYCQGPKLNSIVSATPIPTIFLDFDGQTVHSAYWQNGNTFVCAPSVLTDVQITEIFNRVSEDYRPFAVNITTDSIKYFAAPITQRTRIIVTPTSAWQPGVGGISFIGTFSEGSETPAFVFPDRIGYTAKNIAECCTHEAGHTLGLAHQSSYDGNCNYLAEYNAGSGNVGDQTSWAPVMGNSYTRNMTGWNDGPTPYDCSYLQDNLTTIVTGNGFTYRNDDYNQTMDLSTTAINASGFNVQGVISTATDKDAFRLVMSQTGTIHFTAVPYSVGANNDGADLDVAVELHNASGTLIRTYNPLTTMDVTVDTTLNAGVYFLVVAGAGNNNTTNYGSLGSYTLSGAKGVLAIHSVTLTGSIVKAGHLLSWNVIADEPIATQVLEASENGFNFHTVMTANGNVHTYINVPTTTGTMYYRLTATSVINQTMTSNIVILKANGAERQFAVSTLVNDNISVNASENYNYALFDANGRILSTGKNTKGMNFINVSMLSKGMYVLQMMTNDYKQTERIIKQ